MLCFFLWNEGCLIWCFVQTPIKLLYPHVQCQSLRNDLLLTSKKLTQEHRIAKKKDVEHCMLDQYKNKNDSIKDKVQIAVLKYKHNISIVHISLTVVLFINIYVYCFNNNSAICSSSVYVLVLKSRFFSFKRQYLHHFLDFYNYLYHMHGLYNWNFMRDKRYENPY